MIDESEERVRDRSQGQYRQSANYHPSQKNPSPMHDNRAVHQNQISQNQKGQGRSPIQNSNSNSNQRTVEHEHKQFYAKN